MAGIGYMISNMLPIGGTSSQVGPLAAETSLDRHGSGHSHASVPFQPVSCPASASLAGHQIWDLDTDSEESLELESVLSVQLAYPLLRQDTQNPRHVSAAPSFIILSPHIPLDALELKITGKRNRASESPNHSVAFGMLGSSLHTNSVFSRSDATRHLESFRHAAEAIRLEQQLRNRQLEECWSLAHIRVALSGCSEQCLICLSVFSPCLLFAIIVFVLCFYVGGIQF